MTEERATVGDSAQEVIEKSRLRSLFEARDEAATAIREAPLKEYEVPRQVVNQHVRSSVTAYILECEPLFKNTEAGLEYWQKYQFKPIPLPRSPPDRIVGPDGPLDSTSVGPTVKRKEIIGIPDSMIEDSRQIAVTGIGSYVSLPSPIEIRWVGFGSDSPNLSGESSNTEITQVQIPRQLSESAFRATNKLLADLDIGLDAEQATPPAEI
jgi:hypothetical protein